VQDLVIIPTYERPEMLWLCLEHLAGSPDHHTVQIQVYVDNHIGQAPPPVQEIVEVVQKFRQLDIRVKARQPHQFHGNSLNVMMAYKDAYETDAKLVFLIEDDVLIHPQFFAWHRQQHEQKIGCSIGVVREKQHGPYASLGVCFRRETLKLLVPHCRVEYFQNLRGYCRKYWPPSLPWDCEQDGLWCRLLIGHHIVWSPTPMAQHVGWYGYHRKKSIKPHGTLEQRFAQVQEVLTNAAVLRVWQKDFGDVLPLAIG